MAWNREAILPGAEPELPTVQYYFESYYFHEDVSACDRAASENQQLGQVEERNHPVSGYHCRSLTNIGKKYGCTEEEFMPLLNKLYRRYGFSESQIIYRNVNFFCNTTPSFEDPTKIGANQIIGSAVILYRSYDFNRIELKIEVTPDGDELLDATPYRDAMSKLLPKVRCEEFIKIYYTPDELDLYAQLNETAKPLVERVRDYFSEKTDNSQIPEGQEKNVRLAGILKKLCKKYGFTYAGYNYYHYTMYKRTYCGHYIQLILEAHSASNIADMIRYTGAGFDYYLGGLGCTFEHGDSVLAHYNELFTFMEEAENTVLRPLAEHFPETPAWFHPTQY